MKKWNKDPSYSLGSACCCIGQLEWITELILYHLTCVRAKGSGRVWQRLSHCIKLRRRRLGLRKEAWILFQRLVPKTAPWTYKKFSKWLFYFFKSLLYLNDIICFLLDFLNTGMSSSFCSTVVPKLVIKMK